MTELVAGVDEAGRGPVIGPLVVAGVAVDDIVALRNLGVKDSKKLSPAARERLAPQIKRLSVDWKIRAKSAAELDLLMESKTMNEIEIEMYAEVISLLKPTHAYVDAVDVDEKRFAADLMKRIPAGIIVVAEHKADDTYPHVAAASILAKTLRDSEVQKISESLGGKIGSGYPSDQVTIAFLEKYVKDNGRFPPHVRRQWKTAKDIWKRATGLDRYATR